MVTPRVTPGRFQWTIWVPSRSWPGSDAQLSVTGKGERLRHVLLPAIVSRSLLATRGDAGPDVPVFRPQRWSAALPAGREPDDQSARLSVPASIRRYLRTGCATPTRAMLSGAARPWARSATRSGTPTWRRRAPTCTRAPTGPPGSCLTKAYFVEEDGGPDDGRP
jgi:hypothetical protein